MADYKYFSRDYWKERRRARKAAEAERKAKEKPLDTLWSWIKTGVGAIVIVMIINGLAIASFVVPTGSMENTVLTGDFLFVNKFVYGPSTPQVIPFLNIPLPFYKFPGPEDPEKGDVIVFIFPGNRDEVKSPEFMYYLKRCVATAGDTLQIINKKVFVNGKSFPLPPQGREEPGIASAEDSWITFPAGRGFTRDNYGPIRIPKKGDIITLAPSNFNEWAIFIAREGHKVSTDGVKMFIDDKPADKYTVTHDYCFGMGDNRDHSADSRYWGFIPYENVVGSPIVVYWSWDTNQPFANLGDKLKSIRWGRIGTIIN
ncbi:MAG: signal peptidase I [Chloroflexota bacterium]